MQSSVLIRELTRLKLRLALRHFRRNVGNTIALVVAWLGMGLGVLSGCLAIGMHLFSQGSDAPQEALRILVWILWVICLVWMFSPFAQIDMQRNLDLNGLRLLPLTGSQFLLAVLLDALVSPLSLFVLPYALLFLAALAFGGVPFWAMAVSLLLLVLILLSYAQAVYLLVSRLMQSRRFAELSMLLGMLIVVLVQVINFSMMGGVDNIGGDVMNSPLARYVAPVQALLAWSFPTLGAQAAGSVMRGDIGAALRDWALMLAWLLPGLLLLGRTARAFYEGELESGGLAEEQGVRERGRGLAGLLPEGPLQALVEREQRYAKRDPMFRSMLIQSLFFAVYTCVVMVLVRGRIMGDTAGGGFPLIVNYVLLGLSFGLTYSESGLLFNRFGYEGSSLTSLLASPVSRRSLLQAKSLYLLTHLGAINLLLVLAMGLILQAQPLFIAAALLMIVANIFIVDMAGNFMSIAYPFAMVRVGRRVRAVMPQQGCSYLFIYGLLFNLCNLVVLPGSLAIVLGTAFLKLPGLLMGALIAGLLVFLLQRYSLNLATGFLESRELRLLAALSRPAD